MPNWRNATDKEIAEAMDALDATIPQSANGLKLRYCGPFCSEDMPHYEFWRRSAMNTTFDAVLK